jgi:peptidoglycan/LPS O-acetylase OafA/YrhL
MHAIFSRLLQLLFLKKPTQLSAGGGSAAAPRTDIHGVVHRNDIDGLRAVAVLPVVAFHAGITLIPGGFVGVDVFFVISGFLISNLLLKDMQAGRFSILKFYERRIRRIFPALIVVLLATFVVAWYKSLPGEMVNLSKSALAALLSVSNIYFWLKSGYFDGSALSAPLLHTWSLAVEEQFYIFWPLFLRVAFAWGKRRLVAATVVIFSTSFVISVIGAFTFKDASYYLVHTRGWELLLGGLIALGVEVPEPRWLRETLAISALLAIVLSVLLTNGDMPFPGALALPPTLGAAALIWVGAHPQQTLVSRLLSTRPVVFIGLISYSLYLWHWPIAVFQRNSSLLIGSGPDWLRKVVIILVSIALAYLSWRFVEQPMRAGKHRPTPRQLGWMALAASIVVAAISSTLWLQRGVPNRFTEQQIQMASYLDFDPKAIFRDGTCFLRERTGVPTVADECLSLDASRPNYLVLGDSHAAQLWSGLTSKVPDIHFLQLTAVGCLPTRTAKLGETQRCRDAFDIAFNSVVTRPEIKLVIIAGRWTFASLHDIDDTLAWLHQRNIPTLLVGPSVIYDIPLPRLLVNQLRLPTNSPDTHQDRSLVELDRQMAALAQTEGARYFSLINGVCNHDHCQSIIQGVPMVFDREHFTDRGSEFIAQQMDNAGVLRPVMH